MKEIDIPLISCLCVTHKKDYALRRVINCFLGQTYQNLELVILYEDDDDVADSVLQDYQNISNIQIHKISSEPKKSLGSLRNLSIDFANGTYYCQWDDDDWYSIDRVAHMYSRIGEHKSLLLDQWFIYDHLTQQAYLSNKRTWEGSLLYKIEDTDNRPYYSEIPKGEDTHLIDFLKTTDQLELISAPHLYIYSYDGHNTWDRAHWEGIFISSTKLDSLFSSDIGRIMTGAYSVQEASYRLGQIYEYLMTSQK